MTPTTEAAKRLEDRLAYDKDPAHYEPGDYLVEYRPLILAIEAEAAAAVLVQKRGEVEALPQQTVHADPFFPDTFDYQTVGRAAVLALLADPAEPEPSR